MAAIDERIKALAQSVELLTPDLRETHQQLETFGKHLDAVVDHLNTVVSALGTLADVARVHDKRLSNLDAL